ncbi:hypothetical protein MMC24_005062 [Lignoscripta atroalba]|nr:hypothetical protein [Lignoscripta atroalba]
METHLEQQLTAELCAKALEDLSIEDQDECLKRYEEDRQAIKARMMWYAKKSTMYEQVVWFEEEENKF